MNNMKSSPSGNFWEYRIFFRKEGRAVYISHLDLYRTMQRAVKRAGLPAWETEGFNRHIYLTFSLPLSLGISGLCESFDIRLTREMPTDEIRESFNLALPEDMQVVEAAAPVFKHTAIKSARYLILCEKPMARFGKFLVQEQIFTEKKTKKKGVATVDIKPHIELVSAQGGELVLDLPAGNDFSLNPMLVIEAYGAFSGEKPRPRITRTHVFMDGKELFR